MKELENLKQKVEELEKERDESIAREKLYAATQNLTSKSLLDMSHQIVAISSLLQTQQEQIQSLTIEFEAFKEVLGMQKPNYNYFKDNDQCN